MAYWGDIALKTWVNISPSSQWANRQVEPYLGLPFGGYLQGAPPRRQRALTGPLDPSQNSIWHRMQIFSSLDTEQRTDEQTECAFLSKLPYDVRLIIYEMVLGGNVLHLSAQKPGSRIVHYVCKQPDKIAEQDLHHTCSDYSNGRPSSAPREHYPQATGLLPLLVTCRRIYSEAIGTLYSANTFEFTQNFAAFSLLKYIIPSQRLPCFRHLRLHMRIPRHPSLNSRATRDWQNLWAFFRDEMSGLQNLYLELQMLQPMEEQIQATEDNDAERWIKPIVVMALDAYRRRGCKVELETRRVRHEPAILYKGIVQTNGGNDEDMLVGLTCASLHEHIRLSLG
ncbi:unnamed protein product [Zymoseptoria tritici ST99CH_3D1]|uniref:DUF7730 domain-containing protein n=2 Tax=Zymoseptoria tritici TaxID=1047171 RepID=A0A1X7RNZ7_ZYMT9|nr:unnamed protein product [Zymoseptoria tritici ST99CH_3D7]SMR48962.1 unnamed protein product [Zymoseptoria tritici ST99CH_1E4]SMR50146.1 unnamed protein product [Zymoseptoria tritici ST99CH_3D1]